jgi:long-chain acyl-CoA synthetase
MAMNLVELAEEKIRDSGEYVYAVFEGRDITNLEAERASRRLAAALRRLNVRRGDRVLVQMPNCPEVFQSFGAIWRIGATVVPVNHMIGAEESAFIYRDCGAETLISNTDFLPRIESCQANTPALRNVILVGSSVPKGYHSYQQLIDGNPEEPNIAGMDDTDLAAIVYTAGTTGRPKGAMHTHHSLYSAGKMLSDSVPVPEGTVSVFVLPMCHVYGISCMVGAFFHKRGKAVILSSFTVDKIFEAIQTYRANLFTGVPTLYVYMLLHPHPEKCNLSSMKWWISGSAALAPETWRGFKEKLGFEIIEGWGLTETGASGCCNPPDGPKKVGSIGRPMPGAELKIVDDQDREVPRGQQGEIILRTPGMMKGYWKRPEETAEILRDGWVRTGDIGYVDEDGFYFITDRKKDIIIKGGENICPREIEEVIMTHPSVCEAAVVGVKDGVYGEEIKAFVVVKPGIQVTSEELNDLCCARLKRFKTPKDFTFMNALPKNLVGKVLRKELRKMAQESQKA